MKPASLDVVYLCNFGLYQSAVPMLSHRFIYWRILNTDFFQQPKETVPPSDASFWTVPVNYPGEALANREVFWRLSQFKAQRVGVDGLMICDWQYDNDQHYDYHVVWVGKCEFISFIVSYMKP